MTRLRGSAKASRLPSQEPAVPFHVDARGEADDLLMPFEILAHGPSELLRSKIQNQHQETASGLASENLIHELSNLLLHLGHILDRVLVRIGPVAVDRRLDLDRRLGRERVRPVIAARGSR